MIYQSKSMTWPELQYILQDTIERDASFVELTISEIVEAFGMHAIYVEGGHDLVIQEQLDVITVSIKRRS